MPQLMFPANHPRLVRAARADLVASMAGRRRTARASNREMDLDQVLAKARRRDQAVPGRMQPDHLVLTVWTDKLMATPCSFRSLVGLVVAAILEIPLKEAPEVAVRFLSLQAQGSQL